MKKRAEEDKEPVEGCSENYGMVIGCLRKERYHDSHGELHRVQPNCSKFAHLSGIHWSF